MSTEGTDQVDRVTLVNMNLTRFTTKLSSGRGPMLRALQGRVWNLEGHYISASIDKASFSAMNDRSTVPEEARRLESMQTSSTSPTERLSPCLRYVGPRRPQ